MSPTPRRLVVYARVSTADQTCQNQLDELRQYVTARGWTIAQEFVDSAVSGMKESRPELDALLKDARRRKFDTLLVWSLDRVGRNLRHLLGVLEELQSLNVAFISLRDGIDMSSAAGRLQLAVLGALSQFERERLRERTISGLRRARSQGKRLGRPRVTPPAAPIGLTVREAAQQWGVSKSTAARWITRGTGPMGQTASTEAQVSPSVV